MGDAAVEPGEGRPLERPADRDPLLLELERDRDRHEGEGRPRHEGQPAGVAALLRLDGEEPAQEERHRQGLHQGQDTDHRPVPSGHEGGAGREEEGSRGQDRAEPGLPGADRGGAGAERPGQEDDVDRGGEPEAGAPLLRPAVGHGEHEDRDRAREHREEAESVPAAGGREGEERAEGDDVGRGEDDRGGRVRPADQDRSDVKGEERDRRRAGPGRTVVARGLRQADGQEGERGEDGEGGEGHRGPARRRRVGGPDEQDDRPRGDTGRLEATLAAAGAPRR